MSTSGVFVDFLRHGIAADLQPDQEDAARSLTPKGIQRTRQVAQQLQHQGWQWDHVLTSPLVRAHQTAEILLEVGLTKQVESLEALAPGGSFQDLEVWTQAHPRVQSLAVVGHQPDLSYWISMALWGAAERLAQDPVIQLKKAGLARVDFPEGSVCAGKGVLSVLLRPKILLNL